MSGEGGGRERAGMHWEILPSRLEMQGMRAVRAVGAGDVEGGEGGAVWAV